MVVYISGNVIRLDYNKLLDRNMMHKFTFSPESINILLQVLCIAGKF